MAHVPKDKTCPKGHDGECGLYPASPATPYLLTPDAYFEREVFMDGKNTYLEGGIEHAVDFWGFLDTLLPMPDKSFPSPLIRVRQGQVVHTNLHSSHIHTIHHHGIEPTTHNDGVGHYSFDVQGDYTYQWYASQSGTYFYHCHVNTVLHVEMGMYGALIIDPPTGPGTVEGDGIGNFLPYDVEAAWAVDEIDTLWRCHGEHAALCGGDAELNYLDPDIFVINGINNEGTVVKLGGNDTMLYAGSAPGIAVHAKVGDRILLRYIHAGYFPHRLTFQGINDGLGPIWTVAEDGRPLAVAERVPAAGTVITSAERREMYLTPRLAGTYRVNMEILHWITGKPVGNVYTNIYVT